MAQGKLLELSEQFRTDNKSRNTYNGNDLYQPGHTRALSDDATPEWGKGEVDGRVGGQTDIQTRETLKSKNDYNTNNQYGVSK